MLLATDVVSTISQGWISLVVVLNRIAPWSSPIGCAGRVLYLPRYLIHV